MSAVETSEADSATSVETTISSISTMEAPEALLLGIDRINSAEIGAAKSSSDQTFMSSECSI